MALTLTLSLARPKDLLPRLLPNGRMGGLVLDGPVPDALGARGTLIVLFSEPVERRFEVKVQLAWARHRGTADLKEGFGLDFLPEDASGRDRLLGYAREEVQPESTRYDARVPATLPVTVHCNGRSAHDRLLDLSQGGAFVQTSLALEVGATVSLKIHPPKSLLSIGLRGRVAWVRDEGLARGVGVEFIYDNARQSERVMKLVKRLRSA
jgi:uncharacterized protein (TIGR02266 family)